MRRSRDLAIRTRSLRNPRRKLHANRTISGTDFISFGSGDKASEGQGAKDEKAKASTNAAAAPRGRKLRKQTTPAAEDAQPPETSDAAADPGATTDNNAEAGVSAAEVANSTTEVGSSTADALYVIHCSIMDECADPSFRVTEGDNLAKKKGGKRKATAATQPTRTSTRLRSQGPAKKQ